MDTKGWWTTTTHLGGATHFQPATHPWPDMLVVVRAGTAGHFCRSGLLEGNGWILMERRWLVRFVFIIWIDLCVAVGTLDRILHLMKQKGVPCVHKAFLQMNTSNLQTMASEVTIDNFLNLRKQQDLGKLITLKCQLTNKYTNNKPGRTKIFSNHSQRHNSICFWKNKLKKIQSVRFYSYSLF